MVLEYLTKKEPKTTGNHYYKETDCSINFVCVSELSTFVANPVLNTYLRIENVRLDLIYLENYNIETV